VSKLETLRQAVIDAEINATAAKARLEAARSREREAKSDFDLCFDLLQTAMRELTEATRGTEVAL
jgi:hypothetical protein